MLCKADTGQRPTPVGGVLAGQDRQVPRFVGGEGLIELSPF